MSELSQIKKRNGVVYTPNNLASYVAEKVIEYFLESLIAPKNLNHNTNRAMLTYLEKVRIIDPASGEGELLIAAWQAFIKRLSGRYLKSSHLFFINPRQVLCGLDIDQKAVSITRKRIASIAHVNSETNNFNLLNTNALYPFGRKSSSQAWNQIMRRFQAEDGFDIVITNPPWGADIQSYRDRLSNGDFSLYKGQFDTSDLFIELALSIVKPGGYFAFIVPDSLFSKERMSLRIKLLKDTEIKYIGRFGEKIFRDVSRACAVLICRKGKSGFSNTVDCLRLTPQLRKRIIQGEVTFKDAEKVLMHKVRQSRFESNRNYLYDIYLKEEEQETLIKMNSFQTRFREYLSNDRGVELSKSGSVCKCRMCGMWLPYPRNQEPKCPHCKSILPLSSLERLQIISNEKLSGYEPILVGENVKRYAIGTPHWITMEKVGINYKNRSIYRGPKIVVRKTGVGLFATIDYQDSLTNQVVYIFRSKNVMNEYLPLELFLAILNSRAIYYYMVKSYGETEWRSHPYLTQEQILDLPLPHASLTTTHGIEAVKHIVELLLPHLKTGKGLPPKIDAQVEFLVANLYGLSRSDYERIYETLEDVEELVPIKPLKEISIRDIFR